MMTMTNVLAVVVRRAVESAPCSARQLALEAQIDPSLLTRIMTGKREVSPETAEKLASALVAWGNRCTAGAETIRKALTQRGGK